MENSVLATSGQTVDDMYKYLETNDRLAVASRTLEWRHMAPTAPDTLWCHPYLDQDPFILSSTPDIYIIGNQPSFATTMINASAPGSAEAGTNQRTDKVRCRVILLPKFCESGMLVLVETRTLECKSIQVDVGLLGG